MMNEKLFHKLQSVNRLHFAENLDSNACLPPRRNITKMSKLNLNHGEERKALLSARDEQKV
jgi:hypothetical protein